jgi:fructuronate reductase
MTVAAASSLSLASLGSVDARRASPPAYDTRGVRVGAVHIGLGAFNRAHQMDYFDTLLGRDPRWGVCGVSMHSRAAVDTLAAQDGLYTLALLDDTVRFKIIGALRETAMARDPLCLARLANPETRVVTLTITEKGYCLNAEGQLDFSHADIEKELASPAAPVTAIGLLVKGLKARKQAGAGGLDILSCDNLSGNGAKLRGAVIALAEATEPDLVHWIEDHVCFPNSLVDAITPATDEDLRQKVLHATGLRDAWPIQREAFSSWIIERPESDRSSALADAGVVFTPDARAHAQAKLWLLNGAHSALAYLGLAMGKGTVAEAMQDATLEPFVTSMMRNEIAPLLAPAEGLDIDAYSASLMKRFRNPALVHNLSQIAWDGSQKLPIRLLATIERGLKSGAPTDKLCTAVAAWMRFVRRMTLSGATLVDPMAARLHALGAALRDAESDVSAFLALSEVFSPALAGNRQFQEQLEAGYRFVMKLESAAHPTSAPRASEYTKQGE